MRRLGDIEAIPLGLAVLDPGLRDVTILVLHKGPLVQRSYGFRIQRARYAEVKRLLKEREGLTPELAPYLFDDSQLFLTEEGLHDFGVIIKDGLTEFVKDVQGLPTVASTATLEEKIAELIRCGLGEVALPKVLEVQSLSSAHTFPTKDTSDTGGPSDGPTAD